MDNFTENIKKWVIVEKKIGSVKEEYNLKIQDYKKAKDELEKSLTKYMRENNLTDSIIKLPDGKIKYTETNIQQPITYKFLMEVFTELFKNTDKAEEIIKYIKQRRETKKITNLKMS